MTEEMDIELNSRSHERPHTLLSTVGHIQEEVEAVHATEDMVERSTRINACLSFVIAAIVVAMSVYIVHTVETGRGIA